MKSQFAYKGFLFPLVALLLFGSSTKILIDNYPFDIFQLRWIDYFMTVLFTITLVWLIFFEIKRKMVYIEINESCILTKNLFQNIDKVDFTEIIGYKSRINSTRMGIFEEIILLRKDNRNIILSEFFLKNYKDLKKTLEDKLEYHGGAMKNAL
jgi:hypothetical protein